MALFSKGQDSGAAAVEFALVLPLLMLVLFLMVDFGRFFYVATSLYSASQDAARASALGMTDAQVRAVADASLTSAGSVASGNSSSPAPLTLTRIICTGTPKVSQVTLQVTFKWITPVNLLDIFKRSGSGSRVVSAKGERLCPG